MMPLNLIQICITPKSRKYVFRNVSNTLTKHFSRGPQYCKINASVCLHIKYLLSSEDYHYKILYFRPTSSSSASLSQYLMLIFCGG